jgi:hypothetical protein
VLYTEGETLGKIYQSRNKCPTVPTQAVYIRVEGTSMNWILNVPKGPVLMAWSPACSVLGVKVVSSGKKLGQREQTLEGDMAPSCFSLLTGHYYPQKQLTMD